jgi:pyruvate/2-oxoglutarate dehydrogenase complex dihydrolipoamide acyltransferase (E2) component
MKRQTPAAFVESPASGIVAELLYAEEAVVKVGETIARIAERL